MTDPYFIIFELIIYLQFALCLLHATHHGTQGMLRLFSGVAFGLLLELATIRQLGAYQYGHFVIMIGAVPRPKVRVSILVRTGASGLTGEAARVDRYSLPCRKP